ncbi:MAG: Fpg/Nei family DNA glycosylase [Planctomycetaceae bacterium]
MPELPDITIYVEALQRRVLDKPLQRVRIRSPFLLRTFEPPLEAVAGKRVVELRRLGKRIAIGLQDDLWLVLHLMIAGRLHWNEPNTGIPGKRGLAAFDFDDGTLLLTEEGTKKRASLHVVAGKWVLDAYNPGGLEVLDAALPEFASTLRSENHTLKRALTSPQLFSGIGNAYSDEILHRARLSPLAHSQKLSDEQVTRLYHAVRDVMAEWTDRLREETGDGFPKKVTAFRKGMAVHGRYGEPCPVCNAPVQRIRYAENETNYCARCQTGGKVLADRSLSRLLRDDWPRTIEEWEGAG